MGRRGIIDGLALPYGEDDVWSGQPLDESMSGS
jgi:hypothetical protein